MAERRRLQHYHFGFNTKLPQPCCSALARFGHQLVAWGRRLEQKYDEIGVDRGAPVSHA